MFVYCADSEKLNDDQKNIVNKEYRKILPFFITLLTTYVCDQSLSLYILNYHEKDKIKKQNIHKRLFSENIQEMDPNLNAEANIKRMKAGFKAFCVALNELALTVIENNKKNINTDYDKNFLEENAKIQSQEVLHLIESDTKEEQETFATIAAKEKEEQSKLNEDPLSRKQNPHTSKDSEPDEPKTNETNEPKTKETNEPKTNETDEPKTNETDEPKKKETNEPKTNETNKKYLIFIILIVTCVLPLFFLVKYLFSKKA